MLEPKNLRLNSFLSLVSFIFSSYIWLFLPRESSLKQKNNHDDDIHEESRYF